MTSTGRHLKNFSGREHDATTKRERIMNEYFDVLKLCATLGYTLIYFTTRIAFVTINKGREIERICLRVL